ncbi:MAG: GH92 family glycosyl hydrolase [Bacteroidia bacterium]|nr:GH92 family glycosyl hydrolase [Bacteroidia bacterium]
MNILIFLLTFLGSFGFDREANQDLTRFVNPFIGTGGDQKNGFGNMFPGAAYPFGMIQLSPDNGGQGWPYSAGYHYEDSMIVGFSHTHLSGTGVADYCDISVMPTSKSIEPSYFRQDDATVQQILKENNIKSTSFVTKDGALGPFDKHFLLKYRSRFSHQLERASPGYYSTKLLDDDIDVELTTTEFVGMHRYHFNKEGARQEIILNLGYTASDKTTDALLRYRTSDLVTGYRFSSGKAHVQRVYFAMQFSRKIKDYNYFLADTLKGSTISKGRNLAAAFSFDHRESKNLLVKVAISSVSEEGALANLNTANQYGWNFDEVKKATAHKWNDELSKVRITTSDSTKKQVFYTSLYHSFLAPYRFSDVDEQYKNFNHQPEKAKGYTQYTLLSLWDTFRAENPLLTILQPKVEADIIHSMLAKYRQTGELPYWEISGNEGGSMIGYHAAVLMADAIAKNLAPYDVNEVYAALVAASETNRKGLDFYRKYFFVPTDLEKNGTVSKTLEYSYDDWCIAQLAKRLGKNNDYLKYMNRSVYYKNLYDPAYHLMRGKNSNGTWYEPFQPRFAEYGNPHCVEGNTWQYSFFAPHDMDGLIQLMGGKNHFEMMLDSLFTQTSELLGDDVADVTGLIGQYSQGNEPDQNSPYLYNLVDKPKKTQFYTNKIINTLYRNRYDGLCGNEDCGQMSAWYVFSSIGFYPLNPVDGRYYFGSPQFSNVQIKLSNGKSFEVKAANVSKENSYFNSVKLNGKLLKRLYITYDELLLGGTLEFNMCGKAE